MPARIEMEDTSKISFTTKIDAEGEKWKITKLV